MGADLDYWAPSADFPPSSPRFHGRSPRLPRRESLPSRHSTSPRYPCFALADLIRDSALNLVRYTAVCMPRLALPATSATNTLSHPLLSFSATLLPTHRAQTHTYTLTRPYPGSPRLLFPPRSPSFSRANGDSALTLFYSILSLFYSAHSPFSILSLFYPSLSLFLSFFLSSSYVRHVYLLVFLFSPLVLCLSPRATTPASSLPLVPLTLSREGTLADAPDVSTVRLPLPAAADANGVVTTTDVAFPSPFFGDATWIRPTFFIPLPSSLQVEPSERRRRRRRRHRRRRPLVRI